MLYVLTTLILLIVTQCICISNHHTVYFEYKIMFINYSSINFGGKVKFLSKRHFKKLKGQFMVLKRAINNEAIRVWNIYVLRII